MGFKIIPTENILKGVKSLLKYTRGLRAIQIEYYIAKPD